MTSAGVPGSGVPGSGGSGRLAALDLGSNSFHLLVADQRPGGGIARVSTRKITLRLAEPVAQKGKLGQAQRARALDALGELLDDAREAGAEQVVAVATEAIRRAADGERFRADAEGRFGLRVHLLEGLEEAALSLRGMASALRLGPDADLLGLDLGGGSYEVAYGDAGGFRAGASLPLGAARVAAGLRHDPPRLAERSALHEETLERLRSLAEEVLAGRSLDRRLVVAGTAGTIRDLGRVSLGLATGTVPSRVRGVVVTRDQLEVAYARIVAVPTAERLELPGVGPKRADLLPAGGMILLATLEAFGAEQFQMCDWGLREGALLGALAGGGTVPVRLSPFPSLTGAPHQRRE